MLTVPPRQTAGNGLAVRLISRPCAVAGAVPASGVKPLAHADARLDGVAELLVEGDDAGVGRPHLQVDLQAAAPREGLLQPADQGAADAAALTPRLDRQGVDPAAVAVVAAQ